MNAAIEVSHLTKRYGPVTALDDVTFTVGRGEMYGLIGPDGAGKTTIYRILTALTAPDSGAVKVLGLDARAESGRVRTLIGYMPERFSLYPDLTVMENLRFFASLFGVSVRQNFDLIAPIFGQLTRFPDRRAGRLSGGMKQKLALSCALIHRPRLLLLDEPTTRRRRRIAQRVLGYAGRAARQRHHHTGIDIIYGRGRPLRPYSHD